MGRLYLFWRNAPAVPELVAIEASHATLASVSVDVYVVRGLTVPVAITM